MDQCANAEGQKQKHDIDPKVLGCSNLEEGSQRWNEDSEDDFDDFVVH